MEFFPDAIHLEKIRRALWCRSDFGQAAVLVGSGFSRNAERAKLSAIPFPLWKDLVQYLVDRLYPPGNCEQVERARALTQARFRQSRGPQNHKSWFFRAGFRKS